MVNDVKVSESQSYCFFVHFFSEHLSVCTTEVWGRRINLVVQPRESFHLCLHFIHLGGCLQLFVESELVCIINYKSSFLEKKRKNQAEAMF